MYDGNDIAGSLQEHIDALVRDTKLTVLTTIDIRRTQAMRAGVDAAVSLDELTEEDIFRRCLDAQSVAEEHRPGLLATFREAVLHLQQHDGQAG
jgi:DNA repair protein SbcD/Mre11